MSQSPPVALINLLNFLHEPLLTFIIDEGSVLQYEPLLSFIWVQILIQQLVDTSYVGDVRCWLRLLELWRVAHHV